MWETLKRLGAWLNTPAIDLEALFIKPHPEVEKFRTAIATGGSILRRLDGVVEVLQKDSAPEEKPQKTCGESAESFFRIYQGLTRIAGEIARSLWALEGGGSELMAAGTALSAAAYKYAEATLIWSETLNRNPHLTPSELSNDETEILHRAYVGVNDTGRVLIAAHSDLRTHLPDLSEAAAKVPPPYSAPGRA